MLYNYSGDNMLTIIIIAICLSLDTFSLSLAYGTNNISKKNIMLLSIIVGVFHFIMPIMGYFIGDYLLSIIKVSASIVAAIIFILLGIEMFIGSFKETTEKEIVGLIELLLFGIAVSIDSFSVGVGINVITDNYLLAALLFGIFSFSFTILGSLLGKYLNENLGQISTIVGSIILIVMGIYYLFV